MNCLHCNAPLGPNERFCRNCGTPTDVVAPPNAPASAPQPYDTLIADDDSPTLASSLPQPQPAPQPPAQLAAPLAWAPSQPPAQPEAPPSWPPTQAVHYQSVPPAVRQNLEARSLPAVDTKPAPRRRGGFLRGCLVVLLLLLLLGTAGWIFGVRPYLNNLAISQINQVLSQAVDQIDPTKTAQLPGGPLVISETVLNNLVTFAHAPSSPMQNAVVTVTDTIRLDFTLYGLQCAVTAVPDAANGQLRMTNVQLYGVISWILSSDDVTQILNTHLADAQQRLRHPILTVALANHAVNLLVGPPSASSGSFQAA